MTDFRTDILVLSTIFSIKNLVQKHDPDLCLAAIKWYRRVVLAFFAATRTVRSTGRTLNNAVIFWLAQLSRQRAPL